MNRRIAALPAVLIFALIPNMGFGEQPYACNVKMRYGSFETSVSSGGDSVGRALSESLRASCKSACKGVEVSSDGGAACLVSCVSEANILAIECIERARNDSKIELLPGELAQARADAAGSAKKTRSAAADRPQKPDLFGKSRTPAPQNALLLTRWYGAYEPLAQQKTDDKSKQRNRADLMQLDESRKPLILMRPKQATLLTLR